MTQEMSAARCGVLGWDLSRATLSKIEAQLRCVTDREVQPIGGGVAGAGAEAPWASPSRINRYAA
jgi:hypothetical protein